MFFFILYFLASWPIFSFIAKKNKEKNVVFIDRLLRLKKVCVSGRLAYIHFLDSIKKIKEFAAAAKKHSI